MVWFRVDDTLAFHRKALQAGNAAMGLWVRAGSQSSHELTEGRISTESARTIGTAAEIRRLVTAKLWHEPGHDCPDCPPIDSGYVYHDWCQANPSAAQILAERAAATERQRRARDAARQKFSRSNGVSHGVTDGVTTGEVTADVQRESQPQSRTSHAVSHGPPDPTLKSSGGGSLGGVTNPRVGAREGTNTPPSTTPDQGKRPRCIAHRALPDDEDPGPCQGCKQARERAERYDLEAVGAVRDAIRACRLCDAEGRRLNWTTSAVAPRCDHRPVREQTRVGPDRGEFDALRADANRVPCPTCRDPDQPHLPMPAGQPCVDQATGQPLRAPAHATRITAARKVPA